MLPRNLLKSATDAEQALRTLRAWKHQIRAFCLTRVTNARTEAANLNAKNPTRAGRGYTNHRNYRARTLLSATAPRAA